MLTKPIGLSFILIGICTMAYTCFNYISTKKMIDVGPVQLTHSENHFIQWSPFIAGATLAIGIIIILGGRKLHA